MNLFQVNKKQEGGGLELKTFTGNPVTFTPSYSEELPAPFNGIGLKATILANQDLHGYDHPWSAGGGKNKTDIEDKTISEAGYVIGSYPTRINSDNMVLPSGDYTFSFNVNNASYTSYVQLILFHDSVQVAVSTIAITQNGRYSITLHTDTEFNEVLLYANSESGGAFSNFQLEVGNTATPYAPYSNICPIVGHSELNLVRCGKNQVVKTVKGYVDTNNSKIIVDDDSESAVFLAIEGNAYTISSSVTMTRNAIAKVDSDTIVNNMPCYNIQILSSNTWIANFTGWAIWYKVPNASVDFENYVQVEIGSTPSEYEPYNGDLFTVAFGQTVYGGVYDANSGKVRITHQLVDMGDLTWSYSTTGYFYATPFPDSAKPNIDNNTTPDMLCSVATPDTPNHVYSGASDNIITTTTASPSSIWIRDNSYSDAPTYKTAMMGQKIAYELATPIEIDVSELSVDTIVGVNNIISDCGGDVTVTCLI